MKEQEKQLFKALCKWKENTADSTLIHAATPNVLGQLFFNRMQGIAYDMLCKTELLGYVNREFRNALGAAYEQNSAKNQSFFTCVDMLSDALSDGAPPVAMLKGAYLCAYYPKGYRTSNDIDLLVMPNHVTEVGRCLSREGYIQGYIRNGTLVPASRREIVASKMMRGETVPYIKEVNLPYMKYSEVDINFSLDYKPGDMNALANMLSHTRVRYVGGHNIPTLDPADFMIHLCAHLYKEATTLPWVKMKRDMTLYKYADIYMLLSDMTISDVYDLYDRAQVLGMERVCAYAILEVMELFDMHMDCVKEVSASYLADAPDFLYLVTSPEEKKKYRYRTHSATERFFMEDRMYDLEEVTSNETALYA